MKKRIAFKMRLKPGFRDEYRRRHNEIWPELKALLKESGISEYSIFYDEETGLLFGFQKVDGDSSSQDLAKEPVVQKWWAYMADLMDVNPDNSPVTTNLEEVFFME